MTKTSDTDVSSGAATAYVILGLVLAGAVDFITGVEIRAYPLYFLPVCLAAWRFGNIVCGLIVIVATAIWAGSNLTAGLQFTQPYIIFLNVFSQLVTFSIVAGLLRYARLLLNREKMLSNTDRMTGLFNSRGFFPLVRLAVATCRRGARPLTLAYIDLDHFKCVNDTFGHQRGDVLLCDVAAILKSTLRASDISARLGGDEFAICFPETDREQAVPMLERLRARLSEVVPVNECSVSASIGAVCWDTPPDDIEAMVSAADKVMYRVKGAGKNRVEIEFIPSN